MTQPEPMLLHRDGDEVRCLKAPESVAITPELIGQADNHLETTVRFSFSNGEYTYKVTGWDELARALILERIDA